MNNQLVRIDYSTVATKMSETSQTDTAKGIRLDWSRLLI
jgi:hypothetical protein